MEADQNWNSRTDCLFSCTNSNSTQPGSRAMEWKSFVLWGKPFWKYVFEEVWAHISWLKEDFITLTSGDLPPDNPPLVKAEANTVLLLSWLSHSCLEFIDDLTSHSVSQCAQIQMTSAAGQRSETYDQSNQREPQAKEEKDFPQHITSILSGDP